MCASHGCVAFQSIMEQCYGCSVSVKASAAHRSSTAVISLCIQLVSLLFPMGTASKTQQVRLPPDSYRQRILIFHRSNLGKISYRSPFTSKIYCSNRVQKALPKHTIAPRCQRCFTVAAIDTMTVCRYLEIVGDRSSWLLDPSMFEAGNRLSNVSTASSVFGFGALYEEDDNGSPTALNVKPSGQADDDTESMAGFGI
eukprot:m.1216805 g.1216805  ORF g.1216805 m.1216805 type:complete len:198 (+) comp24615_c0_seq1:6670-7263(+)